MLTITDPRGKRLETLDEEETLRHHFTAWNSGNYQFCIQNLAKKKTIEFQFTIQTGVQATDYSNIVTKKHLRPVELQAQKVQDMIEQIRNELGMLILYEETLKTENQLIKSRVVTFGTISVIVMIATTYLQITYLKNFFRNKKII